MCCGSFLGGAGSGVFFAGALPSCCFGAAVSTPILLLLWRRCLRVGHRLAPEGQSTYRAMGGGSRQLKDTKEDEGPAVPPASARRCKRTWSCLADTTRGRRVKEMMRWRIGHDVLCICSEHLAGTNLKHMVLHIY